MVSEAIGLGYARDNACITSSLASSTNGHIVTYMPDAATGGVTLSCLP